jgi:FlaA1/EpsC-like NDP-sugar epimerase
MARLPRKKTHGKRLGHMTTFDSKSVVITGGSGPLSKDIVHYLLKETHVRRTAIYSRNELKQFHMKSMFRVGSRRIDGKENSPCF